MNVWIKKTRKRAKCYHCGQFIEAGEFQVVCRYYMKLKGSGKTWMKSMRFHAKEPYCWVDRAITELNLKHYVENRGRKRSSLSDENRVARLKILRRRGSVIHRIGEELKDGRRPDKLLHLTEMLEKLSLEIAPFGGVPKSWEVQKEVK